ncbi:MAG: hypothetical protein R2867_42540 [Caldilineaceae bacterium]
MSLPFQDLRRGQLEADAEQFTVGMLCTRDMLIAYPDETLGEALRRMGMHPMWAVCRLSHATIRSD